MSSKQKERRREKIQQLNLEVDSNISPLTDNQALAFQSANNLVLHGVAGTGKSFLSSYLAYRDILVKQNQNRLIYIRSAVPTRNLGYLPGTDKEKGSVYEKPYQDIASEIFNRGDAYEMLKLKGIVEFLTTSYIRGLTWNDAAIVIDECQNMTYHELDSIITRIGLNCRVYFCGDWRQADLKENGIKDFYRVLRAMNEFDFIDFGIDDIVRSDFVKNYLICKYRVLDESYT